ncbi:LOW QUALITY PROTEIN: zinc finger protein Noc-like [Paramacrobiotus metropolitanus]|uniref:LOW QUALITY PROTEIN: zinc finger protein Noc-like n=1 Tax=Paramacrobiotus metropolitanus TaxID=2943436 RepID=UPI002445884C|nr:LOW QUALITY PROTEIN: zinc finger protein Noc-like [Paramacrobiotus metropolitanus]
MISHTASTSANQYVRPDYISPLPTPLDAQKSPLAMLAATCNSIGAPDMSKSIKAVELPPSSKKSPPNSSGGSENKRPRRSPDAVEKSEKKVKESRDKSDEPPKESKPDRDTTTKDRKDKDKSSKADTVDTADTKPPPERDDRKSKSPSAKQSPSPAKSSSNLPLSASIPAPIPGSSSPLSDPLNFAAAARLKTPAGLPMPGMLPYACRDPFCYGCSPSMHCGTNPTVPMDYSALSSYSSLANGLPSNKNLVCGWVTPGMPERCCGKQFLTSEELFAHLRTHTNLSVPSLTAASGATDPLQSAYASYASYLSRFPSLAGLNPTAAAAAAAAASRYNPYKPTAVPGLGSPYSSLWPNAANGPTPGFFSPSPYSYYRPPF